MKKIIIFLLSGLLFSCSTTGPGGNASAATKPIEYSEGLDLYGEKDWNGRVFYEIFVRSFKDSDGDGIGDLQGVIDELDYLEDLGIGGIWLMPINASPSDHGYDVTDYFQVNPDYGTLVDAQRLVQEAHKRDIKVIMDLVINHTGTGHDWFRRSAGGEQLFEDFYIWADKPGKDKGPWGQDVWHRHPNGKYYFGIFYKGMPDLNWNSEKLNQEIDEVIRFWLQDVGMDGYRLDAIKHLIEEGSVMEHTPATHQWLQGFYKKVKEYKPEAFTIGEVWTTTDLIVPYVGDEMDTAFDFDLAGAMIQGVRNGRADLIKAQQTRVDRLYPPGQFGRFLSNHDQNRVAHDLRGNKEDLKLAASLLLTGTGVPFLYYGEEIGLEGHGPHEDIRRPMHWTQEGGFSPTKPWMPYGEGVSTLNVETQAGEEGSLYNHYKALINLRKGSPALQRGALYPVNTGNSQVYAFIRSYEEENLLVLINLGGATEEYSLSLGSSPLADDPAATELLRQLSVTSPMVLEGGGFSDYRPFSLIEAKSTSIIRLD